MFQLQEEEIPAMIAMSLEQKNAIKMRQVMLQKISIVFVNQDGR